MPLKVNHTKYAKFYTYSTAVPSDTVKYDNQYSLQPALPQ